MQELNDDVALHKVNIDDLSGMAHTLATSCGVEKVTVEASQLAGRFQALTCTVQVAASTDTYINNCGTHWLHSVNRCFCNIMHCPV